MVRSLLLGAAVSSLIVGTAAHAAVVNGSFENTTYFANNGQDITEVFPGDASTIVGWTVFNNDISWIGPTNPFGLTTSPGGGNYFLDLSGYHNGDPTGGIEQSISTQIGGIYQLSFQLGSSPQYSRRHLGLGRSDFAELSIYKRRHSI